MARTAQWDLPACRRQVQAIKGLTLALDESEFCRKCSPAVKEPALILIVRCVDEEKPHRVRGVSAVDLQLISEFLSGQEKHKTANDAEEPLQKYVPRLKQLMGI